jgi:hypothetical protein
LDEHELAWAAGFFDGDGWAALVRQKLRRRGRPKAQINQSSVTGVPEVLVRFRDAVGVGRISGPKIETGREPLYSWVASSAGDVLRTGTLICPWLSRQKREQFTGAVDLPFHIEPIDSFAWAAGLFDAEGSTSLSDHRSHAGYKAIEASVTQGSGVGKPAELTRFMNVLRSGTIYGPYEQDGANEPIYRWRVCTSDDVRRAIHIVQPWLGGVKRAQAWGALAVVDQQSSLPRGRPEWGSHKTHCVHGHEYAVARMRPYVSRGADVRRRENKQCLACMREQARARRELAKTKIGDISVADLDDAADDTTC